MISNFQKAFVVHSRPYKETSLIVTFLGEGSGKINAVAKGAKRKNSRLAGNLEPFQCLNIDYRGKSDLKSLILAEPNERFEEFKTGENLYSAFYVNELINFLITQSEESSELFKIYYDCIKSLKSTTSVEETLRKYEINFLSEFENNNTIQTGKNYKYSPQSGFQESDSGYDGRLISEIANRNFSNLSLSACKEINRSTIEYYFEELNIKSRVFFK